MHIIIRALTAVLPRRGGNRGPRRASATLLVSVLLAALSSLLVGCFPVADVAQPPATATPPVSRPAAPADVASLSGSVADVYARVSPAVVNITYTARQTNPFGPATQQRATGSGFIIDREGHVVTNQHVVEGANRLDVTLADGTSHVGEVVGADPANDLAVIRINAPQEKLRELSVVQLGDSSALRVGEFVIAIGNPFGLERSASVGIVSSLGRNRPAPDRRLITNMIQTDAAINPGNSGGPLLNLQGEVIGINAQIETETGGNIGIGFAIPASTLRRYLPDMLAGREPQHAWMGIAGGALTPTIAEQQGLSVQQGVILEAVVSGGPAARAGLSGRDIITSLDDQPVRSVEDIAISLEQKNPGDSVRVTFIRGGASQTVDITLGVWEGRNVSVR
ncbi:MAG: trypsin-like serine protease [Chloroflexi bacterium]|nr:trypsin-like serine protease [Chloroflexota bacterium]